MLPVVRNNSNRTVASDIKNAEINVEKAVDEFMEERILSKEVDHFIKASP